MLDSEDNSLMGIN